MPQQMIFRNRLKSLPLKRFPLICSMMLWACQLLAQGQLQNFEPFMGKTWVASGQWGDGSKFKQEITFSYGLDSTVVITKSKGFTNKEQTTYGDRNHGIRKYDAETNSYKFWEFDVFGGLTEGQLVFKGKDLYYRYNYGGTTVTDAWLYIDANTYTFKVGSYADGVWEQTYLETQFVAEEKASFSYNFDHQSLVVTNLMATGDFYRDVLKLKEIEHPDKAPGFRWFQVKGNSQLHLIKKDIIEFKKDKSIHLCLSTQNLEGMIEHLIANSVDFYDWPGNKGSVTDRSDGVKQIYVQDPDGYWVEINTAKH